MNDNNMYAPKKQNVKCKIYYIDGKEKKRNHFFHDGGFPGVAVSGIVVVEGCC
jgi:hypothetical protein